MTMPGVLAGRFFSTVRVASVPPVEAPSAIKGGVSPPGITRAGPSGALPAAAFWGAGEDDALAAGLTAGTAGRAAGPCSEEASVPCAWGRILALEAMDMVEASSSVKCEMLS